jgi:hypothetical protein
MKYIAMSYHRYSFLGRIKLILTSPSPDNLERGTAAFI